MQRKIRLDVCDYTNKALCNLYDSSNEMQGEATDIIVHTERNGYKEIRFNLPSVLQDGEPNYRYDYLISDYRIKVQIWLGNDIELDWFLISENKITHNAFSKNYEVSCKHISQLLNTKNLDLEFSDEEGNNTGTISQIAELILEGTGWHLGNVAHFYEEEKYGYGEEVEKIRSFSSSGASGAFKMMSDLCELFDAKPLYHGHGKYIEDGQEAYGRTVDILPINPFSSDLDEGAIPKGVLSDQILELYYDRNVKTISRTLNTDNLITKLYAYGSAGDRNGACTLQEAKHSELTFTLNSSSVLPTGEYCFVWQKTKYYFTTDTETSELKWSSLDFSSRSYVTDGTNVYKVYKEPVGTYTTLTTEETIVKNYVPYVMDFTYYDKVGLLTDEMLEVIANHQTTMPSKYLAATEASITLSDVKANLSRTASAGEGYLMLDIASSSIVNGNLRLIIDKTTYSDGVIFRSDYDESKRNYFSWRPASGIKLSGEAIAGRGAIVYIVHEGNPTKWERSYVKFIGNGTDNYYYDQLGNYYTMHTEQHYDHKDAESAGESETYFPTFGEADIIYIADDTGKMYAWFNDDYVEIKAADYTYGFNYFDEPSSLTLWTADDTWHSGDKVYLFSADSIAGLFGPREDEVMSNRKSIEETVKIETDVNPIYFITDDEPIPPVDECMSGYGWYYHSTTNSFEFGDLHFCWGSNGDLGWSNVYVSKSDNNPEELDPTDLSNYGYYYSIKRLMLYKADLVQDKWIPIKDTVDMNNLTAAFTSVIAGCNSQEYLTKGVKEKYIHTPETDLATGNYAFKNEFDNYWLFTTRNIVPAEGELTYDTTTKQVWPDTDENHIVKAVERSFSVLEFPFENDLYGVPFSDGDYNNGVFSTGTTYKISNNIYVHENTTYEFSLPTGTKVVCLDTNNRMTEEVSSSPFTTPNHTTHVRIVNTVEPTSSHYLRVQNYDKVLFSQNKMYTILSCIGSGERLGLNYLMDKFIELSDDAYLVKLPQLQQAQQDIRDAEILLSNTLGDMYREGRWQQNDYVEGDEYKLYADALDNLKEVSHPEATYDITFLDLYGSNPLTEDQEQTDWPDIEITYAAHLVDPDIDINKWAYIDSLDKCYDQPWKTELEINTRLSMIGQQSFTDVLSRIAEIANETKANEAVYKRASVLSSSGQLAADRLEGQINANKIFITGGASNWYTDPKGNMIFEAADGNSAMMLSGRGWAVSSSKDIYGDWDFRYIGTGNGLTADAIYTGYLSAERIEAGSITTDKLSASVGQELDIASNNALMLFATVDGSRPVGGLSTKKPTTDSWIEIKAETDAEHPAHIDIASGGQVNIYGGSDVSIESGSTLNLTGANINMTAVGNNGKLTLSSGGTIDVQSGGVFLINSDNFKIQRNQSDPTKYDVTIKGNVTATSGKIAGFTIGVANPGQQNEINYMYAGQTSSFDSNAAGVYLGDNGINLAGTFKVDKDGHLYSTSGSIGGWEIGEYQLYSVQYDLLGDPIDSTFVGLSTAVAPATRDVSTPVNYRIWAGSQTPANANFSVDDTGNLKSKSGEIGGWSINASKLYNAKTGMAKTVEDADIAFWAGNADSSQAAFKVTQGGSLYATDATISGNITSGSTITGAVISGGSININDVFTVSNAGAVVASNADIKGAIKATSLYIGATAQSDGTQLKLDSNGLVMNNSSTASTAVLNTAGIKVDNSGVVVSSSTTNVSSAVKTAASIKTASNGVVIGSNITNAASAIQADAGITVNASTGVVISSSGSAGTTSATKIAALSVSNGKINISCTDVGTSNTGVYITPSSLTVSSTGNVDFSAANSISLKAGSITMAAISDAPNMNDYYAKAAGITIGTNYIKLDVNANNYVHITSDGIDMKGKKLTYTDSSGTSYAAFGRDDIRILKNSDDEQTVINSMYGKHDWVLIKPYYSTELDYTYTGGYYHITSSTYNPAIVKVDQNSAAVSSFGDGATYIYTISGTINVQSGETTGTSTFVINLGNSSSLSNLLTFSASVTVSAPTGTYDFTVTSGQQQGKNLCKDGTDLYFQIVGTKSYSRVSNIKIQCECNASDSQAPCTVYYFP